MNKVTYEQLATGLWVAVEGYEGLYSVSDHGKVESNHHGKHRILRPRVGKNGYYRVNLSKDGIVKTFTVHTLIAKHFIPNPLGLTEVNHKDEDKSNNRVDNLEWCSRKYNVNYGTGIPRRTVKLYKSVNQYSKNGDFIARYVSLTQAREVVGVPVQNIAACCKGKHRCAGGFIWRYAEEVRDVL
jgi:hypothetical protein